MTEKGKWIFLVDKLPSEVAPPAMSLHCAVPWPLENIKETNNAEIIRHFKKMFPNSYKVVKL